MARAKGAVMRYVETSGRANNAHLGDDTSTRATQARPRRKPNRPQRDQLLDRAIAPVLRLEGLESRTLLSTLPLPVVTTHTDVSDTAIA